MSHSKFSSRQSILCPIFGTPENFTGFQLPTYEDVIRCCLSLRRSLGQESGGNREPPFSTIADSVAKKLKEIYIKASIPTVSQTRVLQKIKTYHSQYIKIKSDYRNIHRCPALQSKVDAFKTAACNLFDIAACKCPDFWTCSCTKEKKVPLIEQSFLLDQRGPRIGRIGGVDLVETMKLNVRRYRNAKINKLEQANVLDTGPSCSSTHISFPFNQCDSSDESVDEEFLLYEPQRKRKKSSAQMRINLTETVLVSQRYGVSDRATAHITCSILKDVVSWTCIFKPTCLSYR